jgi:hypothetical protein
MLGESLSASLQGGPKVWVYYGWGPALADSQRFTSAFPHPVAVGYWGLFLSPYPGGSRVGVCWGTLCLPQWGPGLLCQGLTLPCQWTWGQHAPMVASGSPWTPCPSLPLEHRPDVLGRTLGGSRTDVCWSSLWPPKQGPGLWVGQAPGDPCPCPQAAARRPSLTR